MRAVTEPPLTERATFHEEVMVCPPEKVNWTVQLLVAEVPVFRIETSPWKPPGHWFAIV